MLAIMLDLQKKKQQRMKKWVQRGEGYICISNSDMLWNIFCHIREKRALCIHFHLHKYVFNNKRRKSSQTPFYSHHNCENIYLPARFLRAVKYFHRVNIVANIYEILSSLRKVERKIFVDCAFTSLKYFLFQQRVKGIVYLPWFVRMVRYWINNVDLNLNFKFSTERKLIDASKAWGK